MMKSIPEGMKPYKRTAEFTQDSIPAGLKSQHNTKAGTWAKIVVLEGSLNYRIYGDPPEDNLLTKERPGIIEETVKHEVQPSGPVRFFVEFYRMPDSNVDGEPTFQS